MRTLNKVIEFQQEASNALFTKAQALAITMQLLETGAPTAGKNTPEEGCRAGKRDEKTSTFAIWTLPKRKRIKCWIRLVLPG